MDKIKITYVDINKIKPYGNNPRKNKDAVDYVANSIQEFGFKVPIVLDKDNVIVNGHTRFLASKKLGLTEIPVIYANDLTEEQIKAFRIADNKVGEFAEWDMDKLIQELEDITIDMSDFGLEMPSMDDLPDDLPEVKVNERERTNEAYNLGLFDETACVGKYQMPIIEKENVIPKDLIELNSLNAEDNTRKWNVKAKDVCIHFYMDDYKLERLWNRPDAYIEPLSEYKCILSPDFSLYMDMPLSMKIWNVYRSRLLGQYYQRCGISVIPTIQWAEKETFEFCFDGIPEGSIVSVSTIGVKRSKEATQVWKDGMDAMIEHIKPSKILVYGGVIEYDYKGIDVIYFDNKVTERMKTLNGIDEI